MKCERHTSEPGFSHRNQIQAARLLGISRNVLRAQLIRAKEIAAMK